MNPAKRVFVADYDGLLVDIVHVIDEGRSSAASAVNAAITTTYWLIGYRIVEEEERGIARADYGEQLVKRLAQDWPDRISTNSPPLLGFRPEAVDNQRPKPRPRENPQAAITPAKTAPAEVHDTSMVGEIVVQCRGS